MRVTPLILHTLLVVCGDAIFLTKTVHKPVLNPQPLNPQSTTSVERVFRVTQYSPAAPTYAIGFQKQVPQFPLANLILQILRTKSALSRRKPLTVSISSSVNKRVLPSIDQTPHIVRVRRDIKEQQHRRRRRSILHSNPIFASVFHNRDHSKSLVSKFFEASTQQHHWDRNYQVPDVTARPTHLYRTPLMVPHYVTDRPSTNYFYITRKIHHDLRKGHNTKRPVGTTLTLPLLSKNTQFKQKVHQVIQTEDVSKPSIRYTTSPLPSKIPTIETPPPVFTGSYEFFIPKGKFQSLWSHQISDSDFTKISKNFDFVRGPLANGMNFIPVVTSFGHGGLTDVANTVGSSNNVFLEHTSSVDDKIDTHSAHADKFDFRDGTGSGKPSQTETIIPHLDYGVPKSVLRFGAGGTTETTATASPTRPSFKLPENVAKPLIHNASSLNVIQQKFLPTLTGPKVFQSHRSTTNQVPLNSLTQAVTYSFKVVQGKANSPSTSSKQVLQLTTDSPSTTSWLSSPSMTNMFKKFLPKSAKPTKFEEHTGVSAHKTVSYSYHVGQSKNSSVDNVSVLQVASLTTNSPLKSFLPKLNGSKRFQEHTGVPAHKTVSYSYDVDQNKSSSESNQNTVHNMRVQPEYALPTKAAVLPPSKTSVFSSTLQVSSDENILFSKHNAIELPIVQALPRQNHVSEAPKFVPTASVTQYLAYDSFKVASLPQPPSVSPSRGFKSSSVSSDHATYSISHENSVPKPNKAHLDNSKFFQHSQSSDLDLLPKQVAPLTAHSPLKSFLPKLNESTIFQEHSGVLAHKTVSYSYNVDQNKNSSESNQNMVYKVSVPQEYALPTKAAVLPAAKTSVFSSTPQVSFSPPKISSDFPIVQTLPRLNHVTEAPKFVPTASVTESSAYYSFKLASLPQPPSVSPSRGFKVYSISYGNSLPKPNEAHLDSVEYNSKFFQQSHSSDADSDAVFAKDFVLPFSEKPGQFNSNSLSKNVISSFIKSQRPGPDNDTSRASPGATTERSYNGQFKNVASFSVNNRTSLNNPSKLFPSDSNRSDIPVDHKTTVHKSLKNVSFNISKNITGSATRTRYVLKPVTFQSSIKGNAQNSTVGTSARRRVVTRVIKRPVGSKQNIVVSTLHKDRLNNIKDDSPVNNLNRVELE